MAKPAMRKTQLLVFTRAEQRAIVILVANSPLRRPREAKMAYVASKAPLSSQIPDEPRANIKRTPNSPPVSIVIEALEIVPNVRQVHLCIGKLIGVSYGTIWNIAKAEGIKLIHVDRRRLAKRARRVYFNGRRSYAAIAAGNFCQVTEKAMPAAGRYCITQCVTLRKIGSFVVRQR